MRAVVADGLGSVRVTEVDTPTGDGELVTVTSAGICGSDLHLLSAGFAPTTLGHEFGGRTTDGRLVAVRPTGECGSCTECTSGRGHLCGDAMARFMGTIVPGGLADQVLVEPSRLVDMPAGVTDRDVALVEPLAVAVHGVRRSHVERGARACVIGAGSIGLLTCAALRELGVDATVVARHHHQRAAAERLGVRAVIEPGSTPTADRSGFDVVFDAVGTQASFDEAIARCRPGGTLVEFGLFWSPVSLGNALLFKEITVVPSMFYDHAHDGGDFARAAEILAANSDVAAAIVTHRFALEDAPRAFATAADRSGGAIKVNLAP